MQMCAVFVPLEDQSVAKVGSILCNAAGSSWGMSGVYEAFLAAVGTAKEGVECWNNTGH